MDIFPLEMLLFISGTVIYLYTLLNFVNPEAYSELSQTSKMKLFAKIFIGLKP